MPATLALEKEMDRIRPDDIWFLGDAVGKGPESDKTLDWVRDHCGHFIKGNWDDGCVMSAKPDCTDPGPNAFYCDQLGKERLDWLESLPLEDEILISGISFRLIHGRPVPTAICLISVRRITVMRLIPEVWAIPSVFRSAMPC